MEYKTDTLNFQTALIGANEGLTKDGQGLTAYQMQVLLAAILGVKS